MVKKGSKRLCILQRQRNLGVMGQRDHTDIYATQIRRILDLAVPALQSEITLAKKQDIERIKNLY